MLGLRQAGSSGVVVVVFVDHCWIGIVILLMTLSSSCFSVISVRYRSDPEFFNLGNKHMRDSK